MRRFISGDCVVDISPTLFDQRCCYKEETSNKGVISCGIARRTITQLIRREESFLKVNQLLLDTCHSSKNPCVKGFLAEEAIIDALQTNGVYLPINGQPTSFIPTSWHLFNNGTEASILKDVVSLLKAKNLQCAILQPHAWNYAAIDMMLVHLNANSNMLTLVPTQITISTIDSHSTSIKKFFQSAEPTWLTSGFDYEINWVYLWVVPKHQITASTTETITIQTRTRSKQCKILKYTQYTTSFGYIEPRLSFLDDG